MHLHVALGVGTLQLYTVGSAEGGWQYVAAGEPFSVSATTLVSAIFGQDDFLGCERAACKRSLPFFGRRLVSRLAH